MKLEINDHSLKFIAKKFNFALFIIKYFTPIVVVVFIYFYILQISSPTSILVIDKYGLYILLLLVVLQVATYFFSNIYYINSLEIVENQCMVNLNFKFKNKSLTFLITDVELELTKGYFYIYPHGIIKFYQNDKVLFSIWPDLCLIGSQWKAKEIETAYDILIDYQNKLNEKQNSEQETA